MPGRVTLHLVRHGKAAAGVEVLDPGLDEVGRKQAACAAEALASCGARRLVVSPLARTRQTAEPIAARLGLDIEIKTEVAEVFDPNLPPEERRRMLAPFLGGVWSAQNQTLRAWRARVLEALVELDSDAIVVSHFVAISAAVGAATGVDRVSPVAMPNASITRLEVTEGRLVLLEAADVSHLGELVTSAHTALAGSKT